MTSTEDDPGFAALPFNVKTRIDNAFDTTVIHKRRKLDLHRTPPDTNSAASFIQVDEPAAGGFIRNQSPVANTFSRDSTPGDQQERPTHIPLSLIPDALQILDLQSDDEDVLSVFRNAASGWSARGSSHIPITDHAPDGLVSRRDWRAVCAALLDTVASDQDAVIEDEEDVDMDVTNAFESADSSEDYVAYGGSESDTEDNEDLDDDYHEGGSVRPSRAKVKTKTSPKSMSSKGRPVRARKRSPVSFDGNSGDDLESHQLTARQKKECRTAFALFFPGMVDEELDRQRIRIKEITRAANLLKENISTEETADMLEAFSTAADMSMSLQDFERMMTVAKMV